MVIEWLKFRVSPEVREKFVQKDEEIWTKAISQYPGYMGKEVWINPENQEEVIVVVHWQSMEQWQAVPRDFADQVEEKFAQAVGEDKYEMIESRSYQIRKFPSNS
jgi:uncharacterized protein (TIGR03792 family)